MRLPTSPPVRVVLTGLVSAALAVGALVAAPVAAHAGTADGVVGQIETAFQAPSGNVAVSGWIYRRSTPDHYMKLCVWTNSHCVRPAYTSIWRPGINERYHLRGRHGFSVVLPAAAVGPTVTIRDWPAGSPIVDAATVSTPGHRIVTWAAKYVGNAPYRYGGASPAGFDCSGFSLFVYREARVAPSLPHSSNSQRYAPNMHTISRDSARPGDLIFYLSGGSAYHVAIYAGNGKQYAATTSGEKIQYQSIWSSAIEFRTDWH